MGSDVGHRDWQRRVVVGRDVEGLVLGIGGAWDMVMRRSMGPIVSYVRRGRRGREVLFRGLGLWSREDIDRFIRNPTLLFVPRRLKMARWLRCGWVGYWWSRRRIVVFWGIVRHGVRVALRRGVMDVLGGWGSRVRDVKVRILWVRRSSSSGCGCLQFGGGGLSWWLMVLRRLRVRASVSGPAPPTSIGRA